MTRKATAAILAAAALRSEIGEAVRRYLVEEAGRGLKRSSIAQARAALVLLVRALAAEGVRRVRALEPEVVSRAAARLLRRDLAPSTVAARLGEVRRFTRWLSCEGRTLGDVGSHIPRMRVERAIPKRVLSLRQVARLYAVTAGDAPLRQRDRALLEVLYAAGARRSEAAALEVRDVDFGDGALTIRRGKGDKARVVPLPEKAVATLARYVREGRPLLLRREDGEPRRRDTGVLLLSFTGRPLRANGVEALVRKLARRADFAKRRLAPHALRHAIATHLVREGVSLRHVQLFLGHAFIDTTAIYTHLAKRDLRNVLDRAHPRERDVKWPEPSKRRGKRLHSIVGGGGA